MPSGVGQYRDRIAVSDYVIDAADSFGAPVKTPTFIGKFWCTVTPLGGNEQVSSEQRFAKAQYQISMPKQPGILFRPRQTVIWQKKSGDRTLNILEVRNPGEGLRAKVWMTAEDYAG